MDKVRIRFRGKVRFSLEVKVRFGFGSKIRVEYTFCICHIDPLILIFFQVKKEGRILGVRCA